MWSVVKLELAKYFARLQVDIKKNKAFTETYRGHVEHVLELVRRKYPANSFMNATRSDLEELLKKD